MQSRKNSQLHPNGKSSAKSKQACPDCDSDFAFFTQSQSINRRQFVKTAGVATVTAIATSAIAVPTIIARAAGPQVDPSDPAPLNAAIAADATAKPAPETLVKKLYDSLAPEQRKVVAFDWDYTDERGLLRTRVANNWQITKPMIDSEFFTRDQQDMIRAIYEGLLQPEWIPKIDRQLHDDGRGYGKSQSIALFGNPDNGKFEMVMTGRHMTIRVDGHSTEHMALGGPIFHGHAASGFNEEPSHPGNVFWPQAVAANKIFEMLDGKQRKLALQANSPKEQAVGFRGATGEFPGIPVTELSRDQREQLEKTLAIMLSPYRAADHDEITKCLKKQGGVDRCALSFYQDEDIGNDGVWDNWRLEGPSFVWYFRGSPHVHLWINIADTSDVKTNAG